MAAVAAESTAMEPPAHPRVLSPGAWRRRELALAAIGVLGVSQLPGCARPLATSERIVDTATGRETSTAELLQQMRACDFVLLGERHDNTLHHRRRGELLAALGASATVVAEHLPRGRQVAPGPELLARLEQAGFDPRGWQWPAHQSLFAALLEAGLPLLGGNAPRELVRQVARDGPPAWPADLRPMLESAPLAGKAQAALDRDLVDGHCGQLPAARVPAMRAAQRLRDASMAQALLDARGRPSVLLAGNGHVRTDHGVPQLLRVLRPQARWISVGFIEGESGAGPHPYTHLWLTPVLPRVDPCAGLRMPAPAASGAAQRTV